MFVSLNKNYLILLIPVLILCACYNDDPSENPGENLPFTQIDGLFDLLKSGGQLFTADATNEIIIDGDDGIKITIPGNTLKDQSGNQVVGDVNIVLKELYDKRKMVLNNVPTTASGKLLESGGAFFLGISQNGEDLQLDSVIQAELPISNEVSATDEMTLFWGEGDLSGSDIWVEATDGSTVENVNGKLQANFSRFNWINTDYFYDTSLPRTTVKAAPIGVSITDGLGFIVFKEINAVMRMPFSGSLFEAGNVPVGLDAYLVIIGMDPKNLFFGSREVTISESLVTEVSLSFSNEDLIRQSVLGLP